MSRFSEMARWDRNRGLPTFDCLSVEQIPYIKSKLPIFSGRNCWLVFRVQLGEDITGESQAMSVRVTQVWNPGESDDGGSV